MNIIRKIAIEAAYHFYPSLYKKRFFKKLNHLNQSNIYERNVELEFLLLSQYLDLDSVFFDVGVNMGSYLYFTENMISNKNIYGFEPHPRLYKRLVHLFPKLNLYNLALSDKQGTLKFKVPIVESKEYLGRGTLNIDYAEKDETSSVIFDVNTNTLDSFVEENNIQKISLLKIDVEGAELSIIKGGENIIKKLKPILLIEVEERHHNDKIWNIIQPILQLGYVPFYLDRTDFSLKELTSSTDVYQNISNLTNKKLYINNFLFLHK